jgi:hypothetical protein
MVRAAGANQSGLDPTVAPCKRFCPPRQFAVNPDSVKRYNEVAVTTPAFETVSFHRVPFGEDRIKRSDPLTSKS